MDACIVHLVKAVLHVLSLILWLVVHLFLCDVILAPWDVPGFVPVHQLNELTAEGLFHFFAADFEEVIDNLRNILMVVHT